MPPFTNWKPSTQRDFEAPAGNDGTAPFVLLPRPEDESPEQAFQYQLPAWRIAGMPN